MDWRLALLLDFGITDDEIAETTAETGIGILERLAFSWEEAFPPPELTEAAAKLLVAGALDVVVAGIGLVAGAVLDTLLAVIKK